jgi:hypothetical protein
MPLCAANHAACRPLLAQVEFLVQLTYVSSACKTFAAAEAVVAATGICL